MYSSFGHPGLGIREPHNDDQKGPSVTSDIKIV